VVGLCVGGGGGGWVLGCGEGGGGGVGWGGGACVHVEHVCLGLSVDL